MGTLTIVAGIGIVLLAVLACRAAGDGGDDPAAARQRKADQATPTDPRFDTSDEGLEERPVPGGGYGVDLQGRFRKRTEASDVPADRPDDAGAPAPAARKP